MFLSVFAKVMRIALKLRTFRDRCAGKMAGNSTHQSRWNHPVSLGALGRERKPESGSFLRWVPKMPLPERDMLLCMNWFSICCRSLMDNGTLFFSGLSRIRDLKFSGVHWKQIYLHFQLVHRSSIGPLHSPFLLIFTAFCYGAIFTSSD